MIPDPKRVPGGIVHAYQKYDPKNLPSPTQAPPDVASAAMEHMLRSEIHVRPQGSSRERQGRKILKPVLTAIRAAARMLSPGAPANVATASRAVADSREFSFHSSIRPEKRAKQWEPPAQPHLPAQKFEALIDARGSGRVQTERAIGKLQQGATSGHLSSFIEERANGIEPSTFSLEG